MSLRFGLVSLSLLILFAGYWVAADAQSPGDSKAPKNAKQATKKEAAAGKAEAQASSTPIVVDESRWPADDTVTVQLVFGLGDKDATAWDGTVEAVGTRIVRLRPWRFGPHMKVAAEQHSWQCGTWLGPTPLDRVFDRHLPNMPQPVVQSGLLIDLAGDTADRGRLEFETKQGKFAVEVASLRNFGTATLLGDRVRVSRAVFGRPLAARAQDDETTWFDDPTLAVHPTKSDECAVAYLAYSQQSTSDAIYVRRMVIGKWQPAELVSDANGDHHRAAACYDSTGALWVVYSVQVQNNWDLYARRYSQGKWDKPQRMTTDVQPDLGAVLVAHPTQPSLWLVWQGFRNGQSEIQARSWNGHTWSAEQRVSTSSANDWHPSATVLDDGGVAIAWDTYDTGDYNIRCRRTAPGSTSTWGPEIAVTQSAAYEARPSITADRAGRLWIAYEVGGPHWGKDTGFMLELAKAPQGTRLYEGRDTHLAVIDKEQRVLAVPTPSASLRTLNASMHEQLEYPQLVVDPAGGMTLVARRRGMLSISRRGVGRMFAYDLVASRFDPQRNTWTEPVIAADSLGRLDSVSGVAANGAGLWLAWSADHRSYSTNRPDASSVFTGRLTNPANSAAWDVAAVKFAPRETESTPTPPPPAHPNEAADVARLRAHEIKLGDKTLHIYRGDMHRHTETSSDGGGDGSMTDAYRYAIDAAAMDFLLVTDHHDGGREYDWWRREKFNDLYRIGESFTGLFGYERSVGYPQGHRNVFYTQRGTRPLANDPREGPRGGVDTGPLLYPHLRERGGICFSHTSATGMGTDWRDNDAELEPLVEIFQGDRTNYEKLGAPWSADASDVGTQEGGFQPLGYVNLALEKGLKLGFQASSDHLSTHLSYSCILAERNTRESLMAAMKQRHAYAATDNILLDVRATGDDGEHIMGDVFRVTGAPKFRVHVVGTGKLADVVLIKNDRVIYTAQPAGNEARFEYTDMEGTVGRESYYYVRVTQADRRLAWGSPMWVTGK